MATQNTCLHSPSPKSIRINISNVIGIRLLIVTILDCSKVPLPLPLKRCDIKFKAKADKYTKDRPINIDNEMH